jgi:hypothetical protein
MRSIDAEEQTNEDDYEDTRGVGGGLPVGIGGIGAIVAMAVQDAGAQRQYRGNPGETDRSTLLALLGRAVR